MSVSASVCQCQCVSAAQIKSSFSNEASLDWFPWLLFGSCLPATCLPAYLAVLVYLPLGACLAVTRCSC